MPDRGAAGFGLVIGTLISFGISRVTEDNPLKPVLITLGPAIGISLSVIWSKAKATIVQSFQEEQEMAEIQQALYTLGQRLIARMTRRCSRCYKQKSAH